MSTNQDCEDFSPSERSHVEGGIEECMQLCQVKLFVEVSIPSQILALAILLKRFLRYLKNQQLLPQGTEPAGQMRMAALPLQSHKQCGKSIHPSISEL